MKARVINKEVVNKKSYKKVYKSFIDCVSDGDKLVKINPVADEYGNLIGMIFRNGFAIKENIFWDMEVIVTGLDLGQGEIRDKVLNILIESDYILCFTEEIATYIMDIKSFSASLGVKMGEVFSQ